jgi:hypothetical protein
MAAGDIKLVYRGASLLVVTSLHSLAASTTRLGGWTSAVIDNTIDRDIDKQIIASFVSHASNRSSTGSLELWAYGMIDDSTWPDIFSSGTEGTEGAATVHDAYRKSCALRLLWSVSPDATASAVYVTPPLSVASAFDGLLPPKFALFVTGNITTTTTAQLASSGSQIAVRGIYENAASN